MDKLTIIRDELERRKGDLRRISAETGLSYDTVLRIKNGECDPGFSKIATLADYLRVPLFCAHGQDQGAA
jgi:transcriptional regulator with XRE-family HTH domain